MSRLLRLFGGKRFSLSGFGSRKRHRRLPPSNTKPPTNIRPASAETEASTVAPTSSELADVITYAVSRAEVVGSLNRSLRQESLFKERCDVDLNDADVSHVIRSSPPDDSLISPADKAYLAECRGNYEAAEHFYQQSLDLHRQQLGEHHPALVEGLCDLAALYCSQDRYTEAEPLLNQALELQLQAAPEHVETAHIFHQLAKLHGLRERYGEADACFQKALMIFRQQLGPQHSLTQAAYCELMQLVATAIEVGRFAELNAGSPPLDLDNLSELYSWAKPRWKL